MSSLTTFLDPLEDDGVSQPWTSPGAVAQRPPRLLLTLLGDYWWQRTEPLPSAAIVALLAEFGVSDSAARAALSRLTRNGLLVTCAQRAADLRPAVRPRRGRARRRRPPHLLLRRAVPRRGTACGPLSRSRFPRSTGRHATSCARRCAGWASPRCTTGCGSRPRDHAGEVIGRLKDLGITTATAFRATALPLPGGGPIGAAAARHPGPGLGPERAAGAVRGVQHVRRPAARPDRGGPDQHRRRARRAHPGDERVARLPRPRPRPPRRAAARGLAPRHRQGAVHRLLRPARPDRDPPGAPDHRALQP